MTINPFEFLGIDPHKSNITDLRRVYYDFAKIVHPDRSGTDGNDMHVLHLAYLYCKEQLENAEKRSTTFENLEAEFETFCKTQTEQPPSFRDIMEDVLELEKFNIAFDESRVERASHDKGYGSLMEPSQYHTINQPSSQDDITYNTNNINNPKIAHSFNSIIVYKDPISYNANSSPFLDINILNQEEINNFTTRIGKIVLSDYCEANTIPSDMPNMELPNRTLEDIIKEREHDTPYSYYT
jgi:hypothetical protein